jgi:uncharacterized protein
MLSTIGGRLAFLAAALLFQSGPQIPPPRGLVNDFANVIQPAAAARMERIAQDVRDKSKGEMAIVTLPDLGGRDISEITLRIGREWKVGNMAPIGDRSRNAGVVILLVPKETSSDGHGHCRIETGQGTEGFITDATSGDICREATPLFAARNYSAGLTLITTRVAQRYAQEFGFTLDTSLAAPMAPTPVQRPEGSRGGGGLSPIAYLVILFIILSLLGGRGRGGCLPFLLGTMVGGGFRGGRGGGWGGGGFGGGGGGFGGGGGGGFGGFGGGGGFSGGGGGSSW